MSDGRTVEELLAEVIALLAEACAAAEVRDADARRGAQRSGLAWRLRRAEPARPTAMNLARCVAAGDGDAVAQILAARRPVTQWRRLALILAFAADPGKLAPAPARQADELPFPDEAKDAAERRAA